MCDLSITMVALGEANWALESLKRIYEHTRGIDFEVILVGNNLTTNALQQISQRFPKIKLVSLDGQRGYTQNQNTALRMAKGKYLVLFNDDALLETNLFKEMVDFLENHPRIGAVIPQLIYPDGSFQLGGRGDATPWSVGLYEIKIHRLFPRSRSLAAFPMTYWDQKIPCEVETASGACLMVRREVLKQAGLLDERFKFGMDDLEWSRRIRRAGWKIFYLANQKLIHVSLGTARMDFAHAIHTFYLGAFLYYYLYFGWRQASVYRMFLFMGSFVQIIGWCIVYLLSAQKREQARLYIAGRSAALKFCLDPFLKRKTFELAKQNPNTRLYSI